MRSLVTPGNFLDQNAFGRVARAGLNALTQGLESVLDLAEAILD